MSAARPDALPSWAEELRFRYVAGDASMFLLHGNVRDLFPWAEPDGAVRFVPLREFLERFLGRTKDIVAWYNLSEGIEFPDKKVERRFRAAVDARRILDGEPALSGALPRSPGEVLPLFEALVTDPAQQAALVLDYVETIVPAGEVSFMSEGDKANLITLQRWSGDPALLQSANVVLLVAENLAEVHRRVTASPQLAPVAIPLPDAAARLTYIRALDRTGVRLDMTEDDLARVTAGLTLVQIRGLFRQARQSDEPITFRVVSRRKKSIIEQECHGLVEFVDPAHDFSHVGGNERLKRDLLRVARAIKAGQSHRVPMGILFVGPMGTGKTFIAEAFAAESGLTCLKLKNFRDKWVGSTEANLEKILQVVEGLGYVLLILDEADRSMGSATDGDGGTSSRVIARLKEFMSDGRRRGRVVILMMTNRPDKLDADLKRPGRFDAKIPFFYPETAEERVGVLQAVARKARLLLAPDADLQPVADATHGYSAAELEAVLLAAVSRAADEDREALTAADLTRATADTVPSRDTRMLEFMELLAVFESSSRETLPDRFRGLSTDEVHGRLDRLRAILGPRAGTGG